MGRTLTAGSAVVLFVIAFVAFGAGYDRITVVATLAGLIALSIAILLHVATPNGR